MIKIDSILELLLRYVVGTAWGLLFGFVMADNPFITWTTEEANVIISIGSLVGFFIQMSLASAIRHDRK